MLSLKDHKAKMGVVLVDFPWALRVDRKFPNVAN